MLIILVFAGWMIFNVFAIQMLRRLPGPVATIFRLLVALISFSSITAGLYVVSEFVVNKGPDDWGSTWHAGYPLSAKYGKLERSSYTVRKFDRDPDTSGSGTYTVEFEYNKHRGKILCHYDNTARKFDHDEIKSDESIRFSSYPDCPGTRKF